MITIALGVVLGLVIFSLLPYIVVGIWALTVGLILVSAVIATVIGVHTLFGEIGLLIGAAIIIAWMVDIRRKQLRYIEAQREMIRIYLRKHGGPIYSHRLQEVIRLTDVDTMTFDKVKRFLKGLSFSEDLDCRRQLDPKYIKAQWECLALPSFTRSMIEPEAFE